MEFILISLMEIFGMREQRLDFSGAFHSLIYIYTAFTYYQSYNDCRCLMQWMTSQKGYGKSRLNMSFPPKTLRIV